MPGLRRQTSCKGQTMSLIVKAHRHSDGRLFVAICDSNLIGKKFIQGDMQLDLTSQYFLGEEIDEQTAAELLKKAYSAIFAGKSAVNLGVKNGFLDEKNITFIEKSPNGQFMNLV